MTHRHPSIADRVVAIGASTGGTEALRQILGAMPADGPAIAVVQHMPAGFTAAYAEWLNQSCAIARGAVQRIVSLSNLASAILRGVRSRSPEV